MNNDNLKNAVKKILKNDNITPNKNSDNKTGNDSQRTDAQQGTCGAQSPGKQQKLGGGMTIIGYVRKIL